MSNRYQQYHQQQSKVIALAVAKPVLRFEWLALGFALAYCLMGLH